MIPEVDRSSDRADQLDAGVHPVRDGMVVLPRVVQVPLTLLTGKPHTGQRSVELSAHVHVVGAFASMAGGFAVTAAAMTLGRWWYVLCLIGVAMTLHGMRNARMMIFHQAAHRNLYGRKSVDEFFGRLCAALLLVQNFREYSREHTADHHSKHHMTLRDPTVQAFLVGLDLDPTMSRREMWRRVSTKLISPRFHVMFSISRLVSFWSKADVPERAMAIILYGSFAGAATLTHSWPVFLVGWLLPLFPLFQVSNTLRLCVKHTFPAPGREGITGRERMAALTNAIFLGEPVPPRDLPVTVRTVQWTAWVIRMSTVHAFARYLVLTGDTVCHDFHHRFPKDKLWFNYISGRQRDAENPSKGWPEYTEVWGLKNAIDHVFDSLRASDPTIFDKSKITGVSSRSLFAAFDD